MHSKSDIALIWSFIEKRWKRIALGSLFVVITNGLHVVIPSLVGKAVDLLHDDFAMRRLFWIIGLILVFELVKGISRFLMRYIIIGASWKIENDIRLRIFNHLLKLNLTINLDYFNLPSYQCFFQLFYPLLIS